MMPEYPPITEIPDYVWRMKQPSYYPRPRRNEPKDNAAVFLHANLEEALKAAKNGARGNSGGKVRFWSDLVKKGECAGLCRERCLQDGVCLTTVTGSGP